MDTTRPGGTGDNQLDNSESAATDHQKTFETRVKALAGQGFLAADVSGAIDSAIATRRDADGVIEAKPRTSFYVLSMLLADAYFSKLIAMSFSQLGDLSVELNYINWNGGPGDFQTILKSADRHRKEREFQSDGQPISIEEWLLHTKPKRNEWPGPRENAIKFMHYLESYRPLFRNVMTLIKPGIEDLAPPGNIG